MKKISKKFSNPFQVALCQVDKYQWTMFMFLGVFGHFFIQILATKILHLKFTKENVLFFQNLF